jgi:drug/metabolite transporter (DMT)-like permease
MPPPQQNSRHRRVRHLHWTGVLCGLAAGAWLGGAEVPVKLANPALSPFAVSLCMVAGVFAGRWTLPAVLKGSRHIWKDFRAAPHLLVWGILAGALWSVANTLTIFAIRDIGLAIAFPLWNTNCLVGLFWGWLLFDELKGAKVAGWAKVAGGAVAILAAAFLLARVSIHGVSIAPGHARQGILAALGASLLWGTMYVPYRKAYVSGMNPLSFVTIFTVGELGAMTLLVAFAGGGLRSTVTALSHSRSVVFWIFLGGFCWVVGDLFQQYATKLVGIGRAIPLSNTNQIWGLAWGALVFGELSGASRGQQATVIAGSLLMLAGTLAISTSTPTEQENQAARNVILRESRRYRLDEARLLAAHAGEERETSSGRRSKQDWLIAAAAGAVFLALARWAARPAIAWCAGWAAVMVLLLVATLLTAGWTLWRVTRFN